MYLLKLYQNNIDERRKNALPVEFDRRQNMDRRRSNRLELDKTISTDIGFFKTFFNIGN